MKLLEIYKSLEKDNNKKILQFPTARQSKNYDCGATIFQSILGYYGVDLRIDKAIDKVNTNQSGTDLKYIKSELKKYDLKYKEHSDMSIDQIKKYIDSNIPVILLVQAWTKKKNVDWKNNWSDGHYVVAIGYDDNSIIFSDPSSIYLTYLKYDELLERWHDIDGDEDQKYFNYGLIVYGKSPKYPKIIHMD